MTQTAIQWQAQQQDECWITALSSLSGIPLSTLLERFLSYRSTHLKPLSYDELLRTKGPAWYIYANKLLLEVTEISESVYSGPCAWIHTLPGAQDLTKQRRLTSALLHGKGLLTVYLPNAAHAVAFENGLIVDSACSNCTYAGLAQAFAEWKQHKYTSKNRHFTGWRIDRINKVKGGENI